MDLPEASPALLVKLGSIAVHTEEYLSPNGHDADQVAITSLLTDPEVANWLKAMHKLSLLPLKRTGTTP